MLWFRIVVLSVCPMVLAPFVTWGNDEVIVDLHSGRRLRASSMEVDQQDPSRLFLTVSGESILLRRAVAWSRVRRIEASRSQLDAVTIPELVEAVALEDRATSARVLTLTLSSPDEERAAAIRAFVGERPRLWSRLPSLSDAIDFVAPSPNWGDEIVPCGDCRGCAQYPPGVVVGVRDLSPLEAMWSVTTLPQATELVVWARPFNRSGLADWDSLEVFVQGRMSSGQSCPVRGSLRCTLWGRRQAVVSAFGDTWIEDAREIALMGQWSPFIEPFEADESGVQRIVLPLEPRVPDHDLTWSAYGLLAVEIDIPGQGRLATSTEPIQLRQGGPIRGRSIQEFGSSFLPNQSTSGGVRAIGAWPQSLSGLRPDRRLFSVQP
ncbi:MAG: hypothetical protein AABP62_15680 [Planctomycetota bacterium]